MNPSAKYNLYVELCRVENNVNEVRNTVFKPPNHSKIFIELNRTRMIFYERLVSISRKAFSFFINEEIEVEIFDTSVPTICPFSNGHETTKFDSVIRFYY